MMSSKARGEAQAEIREAEGYKEARIARAEGCFKI